jgi:hypothetical protein
MNCLFPGGIAEAGQTNPKRRPGLETVFAFDEQLVIVFDLAEIGALFSGDNAGPER